MQWIIFYGVDSFQPSSFLSSPRIISLTSGSIWGSVRELVIFMHRGNKNKVQTPLKFLWGSTIKHAYIHVELFGNALACTKKNQGFTGCFITRLKQQHSSDPNLIQHVKTNTHWITWESQQYPRKDYLNQNTICIWLLE